VHPETPAAAVRSGIRRLVLLSGRGEDEAQRCEEIVSATPIDSTILRCSWFAQNFSESHFRDAIIGGEVALPAADIPEPFVDADDIADVAVAALTEDGHAGQLYELTGPRLLTFPEATAEIANASAREIHFVEVGTEAFGAGMLAAGVPPDEVDLIIYLFRTVLDGRNAYLTDGVQRALGREPRDFYDYAWDAAQAGAWDVE
jgi:uncharacterized protein YbjT (DUF2867 family)